VKRAPSQSGFTMIELLVTLVITVFGLMGLLSAHRSLSEGSASSSRAQEAVSVGTQVIEQLRGARPGDLARVVTGAAGTPPYGNSTYATINGRNDVPYYVSVDVANTATGLWRIHVDVTWDDDSGGAAHELAFELLRTSREGL
jgi:prepilin-type N-terminal cleavage/methylation domain-containing protein